MNENGDKNKELLKKYLIHNDKDAYEQLFSNNLNLVHYIIKCTFGDTRHNFLKMDDEYFDIGCIGLSKAIKTFDIDRIDEIKFSSYAASCIRNEILMEIRRTRTQVSPVVHLEDSFSNDSDFGEYGDIIQDNTYRPDLIIEDKLEILDKNHKIYNSLNKLDDLVREIVIDFYGLYDRERLTQVKIAEKYNISQSLVSRKLFKAKKFLSRALKGYSGDYSDNNEYLPMKKEKITPLKYLIIKYGIEEVKDSIKLLSKENKKIISMFYGLKGEGRKSIKQISDELYIDYTSVYTSFCKSMKIIEDDLVEKERINFANNELLKLEETYGKDIVEHAIYKLKKNDQDLMFMFYIEETKDFSEINHFFNGKIGDVGLALTNCIDSLKNLIVEDDEKLNLRYLFEKYDKEKVLDEIAAFNDENKQILVLHYGLNGEEPKTFLEISKMLGVSYKNVFLKHSDSIKRLEKIIENKDKEKTNKLVNGLSHLKEQYGEELVNSVIARLTDTSIKILNLFYGLNGQEPMIKEDIAEMMNTSVYNVSNYIYLSLKEIENIINSIRIDDNDLNKLFDMYGEEKVLRVINKLNDLNKTIVTLSFGLYGEKKLTNIEIAEKFELKNADILAINKKSLKKIESIIEENNLKKSKLEALYNECAESNFKDALNKVDASLLGYKSIEELSENISRDQVMRIKKIIDSSQSTLEKKDKISELCSIYGKGVVYEAILQLNDKTKDVLTLYHGLDGNGKKSLKQLAELYNRPSKLVYNSVFTAHKTLEKLIDDGKVFENKRKKINVLLEKYGEKEVLNFISKLNKDKKQIFIMYYGLNNNEEKNCVEIGDFYNINYVKVGEIIRNILEELEKKLLLSKKKDSFSGKLIVLYEKYGKNIVNEALEEIKGKNKEIFSYYFGVNNHEKKSVIELASKYDITTVAIYKSLSKSILKLEKIISDANVIEEKKNVKQIKIKKR